MKRLIPAFDVRVFPKGYVHTLGLSLIWVNGMSVEHAAGNPWDGPDEGLPHEFGIEVGILLVTFRVTWELWTPRS